MNDQVIDHSTQAINVGSKSFAAAAKLFDERTRQSAVMLYAWCRHCDDVIDGQTLGHGQVEGDRNSGEARLAELVDLTERAYAGEPMADPAFAAFQQVIQRHRIPKAHPLEHLAGFRMDVQGYRYQTLDDTLLYCYRVAGVVGLMMARVMGAEAEPTLDRACDLGLAFQLTNIARDIVEDAQIGRVYLPAEWLGGGGYSGGRGRAASASRRVGDAGGATGGSGRALLSLCVSGPARPAATLGLVDCHGSWRLPADRRRGESARRGSLGCAGVDQQRAEAAVPAGGRRAGAGLAADAGQAAS